MVSSEEGRLWKGHVRPILGGSKAIYQVSNASVRPPLANSTPVLTLEVWPVAHYPFKRRRGMCLNVNPMTDLSTI